MRVLLECPTMYQAGTWFRCLCLARGLAQRGHTVTLVKTSPDNRFGPSVTSRDGFTLVETPRGWGSRWSHGNTRLVTDVLARSAQVLWDPPDVVHTFSHHVNSMLPGLLGRLRGSRTALVCDWDDLWNDGGLNVAPEHGLVRKLDHALDTWSERYLKRAAHMVTVVSQDLLERSVSHGVPRDRLVLLPNGAAVEDIQPGDAQAARRTLNLEPDVPLAVFVGFGQYDLDMVFGALRLLKDQGVTTNLAITGPHPDKVRAMAQEAGVAERVRVAGLVPYREMVTYLQAADVGLLPYADKPINRARWPIKLGDYLAAGLPVVTCQVGEMGRVVTQTGAGRAVAPHAEAFAQGWRETLAQPDKAAQRALARRTAEGMGWDVVAATAEDTYQRAIAFKRGAA